MWEFLSDVNIKRFSFFWWALVIFIFLCIGVICFNLWNGYHTPKPIEMIHYESMRDNLSISQESINISANSTNPCCLNATSKKLNDTEGALWGTVQVIGVVGFALVLLAVFGLGAGGRDVKVKEMKGNKKGASLIGGIISLVIVVVVLVNVLMPAIKSVCIC